ncbi:MAG: HNH endonuclease [Clostridia bacterium]|nr:HNH endonuclease [Clostridia bacterium]
MSLLWIVRNQHLLLLFVVQLVTSLCLIYHGKNKLSYVTEILLVAGALWYNQPPFEFNHSICYLTEYLLLKVLLVLIVLLAKHFSFYIMVVITHKEKYKRLYKFLITKKRFLRIQSRIWNKIQYGIRIKKGMPSMVNKKNKQTGIYFDKDGFPKFKAITEIKLERKYWKKDRQAHFYRANRILYEKTQKNSRLAKNFTRKEILDFKQGNTPSKYTWHHHQDKGVLQLVNYDVHSKVRHNGGFSVWGPKE